MPNETCTECGKDIAECGERHNYGEIYGYCDICGVEVECEAVNCDDCDHKTKTNKSQVMISIEMNNRVLDDFFKIIGGKI